MNDVTPIIFNAVQHALSANRPEEVADGLKNVVTVEMEKLDPGLSIKHTSFFNHSFRPDMIASWTDNGRVQERPIFLRGAIGDVLVSNDLRGLAGLNPMLIGLQQDKRKIVEQVRLKSSESTNLLAAELTSVARISRAPIVAETNQELRSSPLGEMVRSSFVRAGRGFLTHKDAARIASVSDLDDAKSIRSFNETVEDLFVEDAAKRLTRTARLIAAVAGADDDVEPDLIAELRANPIKDAELESLLPYLLERADASNTELWGLFAEWLTVPKIEAMASSLGDLDLTPVIAPAARSLTASKVMMAASPDELTEDEFRARPTKWRIRSLKLSADIGPWALFLASDGRKLATRDEGTDARWDDLSASLDAFDLRSVKLHGLSDRLEVAGDDPQRVRSNVESVRKSIQDDFHVPSVTVAVAGWEDATSIEVDFTTRSASGKGASVAELVLAGGLLARSRPFGRDALEQLGVLASSESDEIAAGNEDAEDAVLEANPEAEA